MTKFITLNQKNGDGSVTLNVDNISSISDVDNCGLITMKNNDCFATVELHDEILDKIHSELKESQPEFPELSHIPYINNCSSIVDQTIPEPCRNCSNHPSNGGSGICFCTLGSPKVIC